MDRIRDLQLFLRVLDSGSISAAARSLNISVAVASARLKKLEAALGVRLFHRTTRAVQVTAEGAALADQGRSLIDGIEALVDDVSQGTSGVKGHLRVSVPASFGRLYISPAVPKFLELHPNVSVHLHLADQMVDLVREGFDLAIRIGRLQDSSLIAQRLASNERVLCAAPAYLRKRGTPKSPEELREHDCLLLATSAGRADTWALRGPSGDVVEVQVRGRLESNFGEVIRDAALAGYGIALHSTWHVCDDLMKGRLRRVLPSYQLPASGIFAVTPQRQLMLPRVRAFIDLLKDHFGTTPPWERHRKPG